MSQLGLGMEPDTGSSRRRERPQGSGARPALVAVAALLAVGLAVFLGLRSITGTSGQDFQGQGEGTATVVVAQGDSLRQIGTTLADAGVVADEAAFVDAASADPQAQSIAPGTYTLHQHMSGAAAVTLMLDPSSRQLKKLAIPEGWRMDRIVAAAAKATGLSPDAIKQSLSRAGALGLPAYAQGSPEGFLFPATYDFPPGVTSDQLVTAMLKRFDQSATGADLEAGAKALGRTPLEIVTVASILEIEGAPDDYDKVARVLYNRLDKGMRLQLDSTVNYALGLASLHLTAAQLKTDSPYNTYLNKGLPPGPINSPGDAALQAALNPAAGSWLYFVTTDPKTKTTEFATTYDQFLVLKKKFQSNAG
jgi:UPF0755 protein